MFFVDCALVAAFSSLLKSYIRSFNLVLVEAKSLFSCKTVFSHSLERSHAENKKSIKNMNPTPETIEAIPFIVPVIALSVPMNLLDATEPSSTFSLNSVRALDIFFIFVGIYVRALKPINAPIRAFTAFAASS